MKILVVMPYFFPATIYGGPIFASYNLCKEVVKTDCKIKVLTTNINGNKKIETNNLFQNIDNIYVKYCKEQITSFFSIDLIKSLWSEMKLTDVVHIQPIYSYPTPIALLFATIHNKKIVLSPRGSLARWSFNKKGWLKKMWIHFFIKPFSKRIFWLSTSEKEKKEILYFFKNASVQLLSDGIDFDSGFVKKKCDFSNQNYISALARIHPVKGFDLLIEAMVKIIKVRPKLNLFIAGFDDGCLNDLKQLVVKLKLENNVRFVGELSGDIKNQFLAHSKCLFMPSHTENFGIVAAESLAVGTPVIASKNTPWKVLEQTNAGLHIENNPEQIYKSCILLLDKLEDFEKNTQSLAKEYQWKNIAEKYLSIIGSL